MKNKITVKISFGFILAVIVFVGGCTSYDEPPLINAPDRQYSNSPVITNIFPANEAVAGVREISINGQNFAVNGEDTNWVFIGGTDAMIKSITADKIVVYRPPTSGEVNISVVIPNALNVAKVNKYMIEEPVISFGDFRYQNYDLTAMEVDKNENLFVATRREIWKLAPDGIELTQISRLGSDFAKITDLKFGPDGYLYVAISKRDIYRIDVTTGNEEKYVNIPKTTDRIDFDENMNLYAVRKDGIYVADPAKNMTFNDYYVGTTILELRVFNGYVYSASSDFLWRNKILDNKGTLGESEVVLDLKNVEGFSTCDISSFSIDSDGTILLCLLNNPNYSVFVLEKNGSVTPFYKADILPHSVDQIIYGSGRYMYLNRGISLVRDSIRVYRMGMEKIGAPYYGRQ